MSFRPLNTSEEFYLEMKFEEIDYDKILVNAAAFNVNFLSTFIESTQFLEMKGLKINQAIEAAANNCNMPSLELLLSSKRSQEISKEALETALEAATSRFGSATVIYFELSK